MGRIWIPLCFAALACFSPNAFGGEKESVFAGKVVSQKKAGQFALATVDGKTYPLIDDDRSRMFFEEPGLRGRSMRLTGRLEKGALRVTSVQSVVDGKVHDVYYWCDACELGYFRSGKCHCCGAKVKLLEVEVGTSLKPALSVPD